MPMRLGVLGLGSVFWGPYASLIQRLTLDGKAELVAGYDVDADKRKATADPVRHRHRPQRTRGAVRRATTSTPCWC